MLKTHLKSNKHVLELRTAPGSKAVDSKDSKAKKVTFKEQLVIKDVKHDLQKLLVDYKQILIVRELEELMEMVIRLIKLKSAFTKESESIFKLAFPFIKKVLPKVNGTLGLAAASGKVSGAVYKVASGELIHTKSNFDITSDL